MISIDIPSILNMRSDLDLDSRNTKVEKRGEYGDLGLFDREEDGDGDGDDEGVVVDIGILV